MFWQAEEAARELRREGREQGLEQGRAQGMEQGLEQGLEQGRAQGLADMRALVVRLAEQRFGSETAERLRRVLAAAGLEAVDQAADAVLDCDTGDELLAQTSNFSHNGSPPGRRPPRLITLAYLGPEGTYSEQAASDYEPAARRVPYPSIPAVIRAVERGEATEAVVPIENSLEGAVTSTTDMLIHETDLKIKRELVVPIRHCLVRRPASGTAPDAPEDGDGHADSNPVEVVYSHPQAMAQCRNYLEQHFPDAATAATSSTAAAVEDMMRSKRNAVAVSSRRAAELCGAQIVAVGIEDAADNQTRFVVLAPDDAEPTGRDKTSICFDFDHDGPGILHRALGELASSQINMLKIESRPDKRSVGRYFFLVDMEGHRRDSVVQVALAGIAHRSAAFKVLGSYPRSP